MLTEILGDHFEFWPVDEPLLVVVEKAEGLAAFFLEILLVFVEQLGNVLCLNHPGFLVDQRHQGFFDFFPPFLHSFCFSTLKFWLPRNQAKSKEKGPNI